MLGGRLPDDAIPFSLRRNDNFDIPPLRKAAGTRTANCCKLHYSKFTGMSILYVSELSFAPPPPEKIKCPGIPSACIWYDFVQ